MRLLSFLPVALFVIIAHLTTAKPAPNPFAEPLSIGELIPLEKRQSVKCPAENDCTCLTGTKPGIYCWGCKRGDGTHYVTGVGHGSGDYKGWVFQCGKAYPS
ncbi:uncharacterized protein LAJ45_10117 [Morchella importuna]|uniref:uncharacterized protein n=1 Tax=Morchella importuna TaxID=1174673 RepID=UPI001E8D1877|nr:uncharacterized protein LAJ45_10117 [Morchella importuna]KAH8145794.1 hypothetical protein LAJ45_10117 [Morchella importuna]